MRRLALLLALVLVVPLALFSQETSVPEIAYDSVPNLLKLPPDLYLGEAAGVAVNSKGDIFVFTRSGHTRLFEFDPTGKFPSEIGQDLYGFSFPRTPPILPLSRNACSIVPPTLPGTPRVTATSPTVMATRGW